MPARRFFLGMGLHRYAADVQLDGGELLEADDDHRPVVATTYFCTPYEPLAKAGVSYQAMYEALGPLSLPARGAVLPVSLPLRTPTVSASDELAIQAAALLLTGRQVCVLGAESTPLAMRLEFIDTVMALLPYGFRTRMTAATWVRPTHRDHRFRLFFSRVARDADPPDHLIHWGRPEQTPLVAAHDHAYAYDYAQWLESTVGQPVAHLAGLSTPRSFSRDEVLQSLDEIGFQRFEPDEERDQRPSPAPLPPAPEPAGKFDGEQILRDCDAHLRKAQWTMLETDISRLKGVARSGIGLAERNQYQKIITELSLLRHDEQVTSRTEEKLREALFSVAFDPPFSYQQYCQIEASLGGAAPDPALLHMIDKKRMSDWRVTMVVYQQLPKPERTGKLDQFHKDRHLRVAELVNTLAREKDWAGPRHRYLACQVVVEHVRRMRGKFDDPTLRNVLRLSSYLAPALQVIAAGDEQFQVHALAMFLRAAYPRGLFRPEIPEVLSIKAGPQLLAAALLTLADPENDAQLARDVYLRTAVMSMKLEQETLGALQLRLPYPSGMQGGSGAPWTPSPSSVPGRR
jgi:hypothetical protein